MPLPNRIMITGCPGSGKSTLARALNKLYSCPVLSLDQYYWSKGWVEAPESRWRETVSELIKADRWIMDGNYSGTWDLRLARTELVIYLDYPTYISLFRAIKRTLFLHGKVREDMASGCPERFNWAFVQFILSFRKLNRENNIKRLKESKSQYELLIFSHPKELKSWLDSLPI